MTKCGTRGRVAQTVLRAEPPRIARADRAGVGVGLRVVRVGAGRAAVTSCDWRVLLQLTKLLVAARERRTERVDRRIERIRRGVHVDLDRARDVSECRDAVPTPALLASEGLEHHVARVARVADYPDTGRLRASSYQALRSTFRIDGLAGFQFDVVLWARRPRL